MTLALSIAVLLAASAAAATPPDARHSAVERRVLEARLAVDAHRTEPAAYAELALALAHQARATADATYYAEAEAEIAKALALAPDNLEALRARAWVLLGQHRFADALELARSLNARVPDDAMTYALLTDAYVELGRYEDAEVSAQWVLDLAPGGAPGLTRAAYLREIFGDVDGALELMQVALGRIDRAEDEDRAWVLTHIGHLHVVGGDLRRAEAALLEALGLVPDYHYALANLAKVRIAQKRYTDAVALLERRYAAAPHPENLFELARALDSAGRRAEARDAFARFERSARAEMDNPDNANRELIFYYADHAGKPREALRLAAREVQARPTLAMLDAHSWALFKNRRIAAARAEMARALATGTADPEVLAHARIMGQPRSPQGTR